MNITEKSHLDHGLTRAQVEYIANRFRDRRAFFTEEINLEEAGLGTVPCALHGPIMGDKPIGEDDVVYLKREGREGTTRLIDREPRMVTTVTVIAGLDGRADAVGNAPCILYTAFGGPKAPKEPDDPDMTLDEIAESKQFWSTHALSKTILLEPDVVELFKGVAQAIGQRLGYIDSLKDEGLQKMFLDRMREGFVLLAGALYGPDAAKDIKLVVGVVGYLDRVHGADDKPKE